MTTSLQRTLPEIARQRLHNQHLTSTSFTRAEEVVRSLGAVQAQDYSGAKWAVAQRMRVALDRTIEQAMTAGTIIRTHVLRPTWHFVCPSDIRWMLALTAPRVSAAMAYYNRILELDAVFRRSNVVLTRALRGGKQLTRAELSRALERAGIDVKTGQRLGHLMMQAELDAVVCSGARRGKQFTYALLDERVPPAAARDRDESLLDLTRRYFTTRGPATARDFAWWSGLTMRDVKRGLEIAAPFLRREVIGDGHYWSAASVKKPPRASAKTPRAHLLPNYDEFFIGLKDRSAIGQRLRSTKAVTGGNALMAHLVVVDGQLVGGWKRMLDKNLVVVQLDLLTRLTPVERQAVANAARKFGDFLELPVTLRDKLLSV